MPQPHLESHFTGSALIRDIVIGMSDGLTVPFALAAGLSGAVSSTSIVITAGLAEVAAGSIAMGLGGYLSSRGDADHYESERLRESNEVLEKPDLEMEEVAAVFADYGLGEAEIAPIVLAFQKRPEAWIDFMMRFELGLERPDPRRAISSALTIGASYVVGGLVPLLAYFFIPDVRTALMWSAIVTLIALFAFGYVKGRFTGATPVRSAFQTVLIGGLAASAAFGLARLFTR